MNNKVIVQAVVVALLVGVALGALVRTGDDKTNPAEAPQSPWSRYKDEKLGIEFDYPRGWRVEVNSEDNYIEPEKEQRLMQQGKDLTGMGKFAYVVVIMPPKEELLYEGRGSGNAILLYSKEYLLNPGYVSGESDAPDTRGYFDDFDKYVTRIGKENAFTDVRVLNFITNIRPDKIIKDLYDKSIKGLYLYEDKVVGIIQRMCFLHDSPTRDQEWEACKRNVGRVLDSLKFLEK